MSSDGTTRCGKGSDASSERACLFPSPMRCTNCVCDSFYMTTIILWLSPTIEPLPKVLQDWKRIAEVTTILELEGNAAKGPNPNEIPSPHVPIPNLYGLNYDEARAQLTEAGWQPFMNHWSYADDTNIHYGNGPVFWQRGYHEIESSSGTGYAFCSFKFVDVYGNNLKVITAGEEYPDQNIKASVVRWFFESATKINVAPWPMHPGVYIATSSETIPHFPHELSGYRAAGNKDYWDRSFVTQGSIRIFEGNDWEPIPDFPLTMNHCSDAVFKIG